MSTEPDHVVLRPAPGVSSGWLGDWHGRWLDRNDIPVREGVAEPQSIDGMSIGHAVATATDRFEVRDDGAVAQVWEVGPAGTPAVADLPPDPLFDETSCPIWSCEIVGTHTHDNDDPRLPLNRR